MNNLAQKKFVHFLAGFFSWNWMVVFWNIENQLWWHSYARCAVYSFSDHCGGGGLKFRSRRNVVNKHVWNSLWNYTYLDNVLYILTSVLGATHYKCPVGFRPVPRDHPIGVLAINGGGTLLFQGTAHLYRVAYLFGTLSINVIVRKDKRVKLYITPYTLQ